MIELNRKLNKTRSISGYEGDEHQKKIRLKYIIFKIR